MRTWLGFALVVLVVGALAHAVVVLATPNVIMRVAMERIGVGGDNMWRHSPRTTKDSRAIVRPSPDLAYSACVYDLSDGPIVITMAPGADYWSLSLYGENSDNFYTVNDRQAPMGAEIVLVRAGDRDPDDAAEVVRSPSVRGIAIQRRLAPTAAAFAAADAARRNDTCASVAALRAAN